MSSCIILIGMMGSGKTSVGKKLSRTLGLTWQDTDSMIEVQTGKKISDLFKEKGETHFRALERELCLSFKHCQNSVISTGGGIILDAENRKSLKHAGFVVWLSGNPHILFSRVARDKSRPLLQTQNPKEAYLKLTIERAPFYLETAHTTIDTTSMTLPKIVSEIQAKRSLYESRHLG